MVTHPLRAGPSPPGSRRPVLGHSSPHRLSSVRSPHGPEHPDSGFRSPTGQHIRRPCSRSTSLRNTAGGTGDGDISSDATGFASALDGPALAKLVAPERETRP